MTPALFLDRDGVINVDHGYVHSVAAFEFMPGIVELVRSAREHGLRVVVVTNQSGIGRGLYGEDDFAKLTAWMCARLAEQGAAIDMVQHCATHPTAGIGAYKVDSPMRKPGPGMLLAARDTLALDMPRSVMLGDKLDDLQAGLAAGVGLNLLLATTAPAAPLPPHSERVVTLAHARQRLLQHCAVLAQASPGPQAEQGATQVTTEITTQRAGNARQP